MAYDPNAYQESIRKYLKEMGQDNYDPNATGGGGGGGGGGGAGGAIGALALGLAVRYGVGTAKSMIADYLASKGVTRDAIVGRVKEIFTGVEKQAGNNALNSTAGASAITAPNIALDGGMAYNAGVATPIGGGAPITAAEGLGGTSFYNMPSFGGEAAAQYYTPIDGAAQYYTPVAQEGAQQLATPVAQQGAGTSFSQVAPYLRGAASAYGGWVDWQNNKDANAGTMRGTKAQQAIGMAVANYYTFGLAQLAKAWAQKHWGGTLAKLDKFDAMTNPISMALNHHKNQNQIDRDIIRETLKDAGALDDNYNIGLADGTKFDLGRDGANFTLKNTDGTERNYWDPDHTVTKYNPYEAQALLQPLAAIAGNGKLDILNHFENAAGSNAQNDTDIFNNARAFAKSLGLTQDNYAATIDKLKEDGNFDDATANIYKGKLSWLTGGDQAEASGQGAYQQKLRDFLSSIKINTANDVYAKNLAAQAAAQGANG